MITSVILHFLLVTTFSIASSDDAMESLSVNTGETATLICDLPERYSSKPAEFYGPMGRLLGAKGSGNGAGDDDDRNRFLVEQTYAWTWSLTITDVSDDDGGEYTCRSSSADRTLAIIKRFDLTVLTPPKIVDITIESTHHGVLLENEQVILRCLTRGNPQPNILWIYSGQNVSSHRNIIAFHNQLLIQNFSRLSPTNYQCIADNGIPPRDTRSRRLIPAIPPEVTIQSSLTHLSSQILLNCTVIARPLTLAKWRRNRLEIKEQVQRLEINDYTLQLTLLLAIDSNRAYGLYECEAENQFKVAKAFINIDEYLFPKSSRASSTSSPLSDASVELLLSDSSVLRAHLCLTILLSLFATHFRGE